MRLLHVHSGNLYGGVETLLSTLAHCRALCAEMYSEFALCFDGRISAELRQAGATVHILGRVRARNPVQVIQARRRLIRILSAGAFDAVICHMMWPLAVFGPAVRRVRLPLIFWMHDAVIRRNWLALWAGFSSPDLVICNSRYTASTLGRLFSAVSPETLYYPVVCHAEKLESAQREVLRSRLNTTSEAVVILQASRMEPWKGHWLLLDALARLAEVPQWVCWIAGGPQRHEEIAYAKALHARATALGLTPRIRFLGQRADVVQLLAAADIYCQPNLSAEPFGIAFIEAMHAGLPVVTTAAGGPAEIIDDSCGVLVQPNDPASLAAQLETLVKNEGLRRQLGAAGVRQATQFCDPGTQLQRLHGIIRQTAGASAAM
ncbi:MAG: glycosyltransferase family 4 protein [Deltaproteobacteria bacterium]|nr:glycosyltransferase family 4 protein [Deltaproteobacteria bacterium]MBV8452759.1 glycosyltransferase family 4 protein [Deltaproteobacteria bacterium]